jgi:hypothetical protein
VGVGEGEDEFEEPVEFRFGHQPADRKLVYRSLEEQSKEKGPFVDNQAMGIQEGVVQLLRGHRHEERSQVLVGLGRPSLKPFEGGFVAERGEVNGELGLLVTLFR